MQFRRRNPAQATVRQAIEYLASACDGAVRRDGHGFNREHVALGHRLARTTRWSRSERASALSLTRVYAGQLGRAGYLSKSAPRHRAATWAADPTGVHRLRYWNGSYWTAHVA